MYYGKKDHQVYICIYLGITPKNTWVESDYLKKYDPRSMCLYLKGKIV